jgi:hypothetical protein
MGTPSRSAPRGGADEYRPDPPSGLRFEDFRAARGRYLARVTSAAEVARLQRAFDLPSQDSPAVREVEPLRPPGASCVPGSGVAPSRRR